MAAHMGAPAEVPPTAMKGALVLHPDADTVQYMR